MEYLVLLAIILGLTFSFVISAISMKDKATYFKMEIYRALDEVEKQHWERELARVYFYCVPFLGKWLYKVYVKKKYNKKV